MRLKLFVIVLVLLSSLCFSYNKFYNSIYKVQELHKIKLPKSTSSVKNNYFFMISRIMNDLGDNEEYKALSIFKIEEKDLHLLDETINVDLHIYEKKDSIIDVINISTDNYVDYCLKEYLENRGIYKVQFLFRKRKGNKSIKEINNDLIVYRERGDKIIIVLHTSCNR